ncbi:hypothetical protein ACQ4PT_016823 [Festuca glaucescens]
MDSFPASCGPSTQRQPPLKFKWLHAASWGCQDGTKMQEVVGLHQSARPVAIPQAGQERCMQLDSVSHRARTAVEHAAFSECSQYDTFFTEFSHSEDGDNDTPDVMRPALRLAHNLLDRCEAEGVEEVLRAISVVWVEMLCYAASCCINDSHPRQLSSGTEFVTVTWILTTALFNRFHRDQPVSKDQARQFQQRH